MAKCNGCGDESPLAREWGVCYSCFEDNTRERLDRLDDE